MGIRLGQSREGRLHFDFRGRPTSHPESDIRATLAASICPQTDIRTNSNIPTRVLTKFQRLAQ